MATNRKFYRWTNSNKDLHVAHNALRRLYNMVLSLGCSMIENTNKGLELRAELLERAHEIQAYIPTVQCKYNYILPVMNVALNVQLMVDDPCDEYLQSVERWANDAESMVAYAIIDIYGA